MKVKLTTALLIMSAAFNANAALKMTATPSNHGTWVKVMQDGVPVAGAEVTSNRSQVATVVTGQDGRAFVFNRTNRSRSLRLTAVTPSGTEVSKHVFVHSDK